MQMYRLALLAGGLATRMRPLTEKIPKALLDVAGQPFIARQLTYLQSQGVRDVVVCTGHLGEQIQAVIGNGESLGLRVRYSPDGPQLLGTGGALRQALPLLGDVFFVMYGDSFLPIDFSQVQASFERSDQIALMTVLHNHGQWDGSNVLWADGKLQRYKKGNPPSDMHHIDYGLGILTAPVLLRHSPEFAFDLAAVYEELSQMGQLKGFEVKQRFYEVGSPSGLADTIDYFQNRHGVSP